MLGPPPPFSVPMKRLGFILLLWFLVTPVQRSWALDKTRVTIVDVEDLHLKMGPYNGVVYIIRGIGLIYICIYIYMQNI
jgi:hypothetical protein